MFHCGARVMELVEIKNVLRQKSFQNSFFIKKRFLSSGTWNPANLFKIGPEPDFKAGNPTGEPDLYMSRMSGWFLAARHCGAQLIPAGTVYWGRTSVGQDTRTSLGRNSWDKTSLGQYPWGRRSV